MSEAITSPPTQRSEICALQTVRRVAAMLDLDPDRFQEGDPLPFGWHFFLLAADTRRAELRGDGFPGLGVPIPDLGFDRLMLGQRRVEFHGDLRIGAALQRRSSVQSLTRKETASGSMALVTVEHALFANPKASPDLVEQTTYVLLSGNRVTRRGPADGTALAAMARRKTITPDDTLLFQYSALGFNSHKIHLDRSYACDVEGFPDLVVNGGLTALLLAEFMRTDLALRPRSIDIRYTAPLFCSRPITLAADDRGGNWQLCAFDDEGHLAADMQVQTQ